MQTLFKLCTLLGLKEFIKVNGCKSFEELVNLKKLKPSDYFEMVNFISNDSTIDFFVSGEDFSLLIELRLVNTYLMKDDSIFKGSSFADHKNRLKESFENDLPED
jgi:hypothetical protein